VAHSRYSDSSWLSVEVTSEGIPHSGSLPRQGVRQRRNSRVCPCLPTIQSKQSISIKISQCPVCLGRQGDLEDRRPKLDLETGLQLRQRSKQPRRFMPRGSWRSPRSRSSLSGPYTSERRSMQNAPQVFKKVRQIARGHFFRGSGVQAKVAAPLGTAILILGTYFRLITSSGNAVPCQAHRGRCRT
jgi:hypothetical protein